MTEQVKMSTYFKLPVNELAMKLGEGKTIPLNCDGISEFQAIDLAVSSFDANQEHIAKLESMLCSTCGGIGCIGTPPDNYQDCSECVGPIQKLSDDNKRLRDAIQRISDISNNATTFSDERDYYDAACDVLQLAEQALEATKQDKD